MSDNRFFGSSVAGVMIVMHEELLDVTSGTNTKHTSMSITLLAVALLCQNHYSSRHFYHHMIPGYWLSLLVPHVCGICNEERYWSTILLLHSIIHFRVQVAHTV